MVELLLEHGAHVDQADIMGTTSLMTAAQYGHIGVATLLLEKGAAVNKADIDGVTPLSAASSNGFLDIVAALLDNGASISQPSISNQTPLVAAVSNGQLTVAALLIEKGAAVNRADTVRGFWPSPLGMAIHKNDIPMAALLLEKGAAVNATLYNDAATTPLMVAICIRSPAMVALLLGHGATIDHRVPFLASGDNLLHYAFAAGMCEIATLLFDKGVDPNLKNLLGETPLDVARRHGHADLVTQLLKVIVFCT